MIELGAGTGLVGILAALQGAWATRGVGDGAAAAQELPRRRPVWGRRGLPRTQPSPWGQP